MKPARDTMAHQLVMLAACTIGMAAGLALDMRTLLPEALASICSSQPSPLRMLGLHLEFMPATHALMFVSAAATLVLPGFHATISPSLILQRSLCCIAMTAGMLTAEVLAPWLAGIIGVRWDALAMFVAMSAGMAGGLAAVQALKICVAICSVWGRRQPSDLGPHAAPALAEPTASPNASSVKAPRKFRMAENWRRDMPA